MKYLLLVILFFSACKKETFGVQPKPFQYLIEVGMLQENIGWNTIQGAATETPTVRYIIGIWADNQNPNVGTRFKLNTPGDLDTSKFYSYRMKNVGWKIKLQDSTNQIYEITNIYTF